MKQPKSIQISIPQPCNEDWSEMTQQEQGRFCSSCQKCVVDFTGYSDARIYEFIVEHKGQKICGRFNSTQLNRSINIPPQPHSQLYKWIIAAGLALVFVATPESKSFAQVPKTEHTFYLPLYKTNSLHNGTYGDTSRIRGTVLDPNNNKPVSQALISIKYNDDTLGTTFSDTNGNFIVRYKNTSTFHLNVTASGYTSYTAEMTNKDILKEATIELYKKEYFSDIIIGMMTRTVDGTLYNDKENPSIKTITSNEIE